MSSTTSTVPSLTEESFQFDEQSGLFGKDGEFGGSCIPPQLESVMNRLRDEFLKVRNDEAFNKELKHYLTDFVGRPSPVTLASNLSHNLGTKAKIYLKREDLNHTGAHKINNSIGQILLAKRMGARRIIAETGAGRLYLV